VIGRDDLTEKSELGPLIVEENDSTTVVPPDCGIHVDRGGNMIITVGRSN